MWLLNDFVTKFILQSLYLFIFYSRPSVVVVLGVQGLISRFWFRNSWDALLALSTALSWHLPSTVPQGLGTSSPLLGVKWSVCVAIADSRHRQDYIC